MCWPGLEVFVPRSQQLLADIAGRTDAGLVDGLGKLNCRGGPGCFEWRRGRRQAGELPQELPGHLAAGRLHQRQARRTAGDGLAVVSITGVGCVLTADAVAQAEAVVEEAWSATEDADDIDTASIAETA